MTYNEPDYEGITPNEVGEITRSLDAKLCTFRHILCLGGGHLIGPVVESLGATVGLLERSPKFDMDGELFTGPGEESAEWFRKIWSLPENQGYAIENIYPPSDEECAFMMPVNSYSAFGRYDPYSASRFSQASSFGGYILWAIANRHLVPWFIVPLKSRRFLPFLFISQNPQMLQAAAKTIFEKSPSAMLSFWNGPENPPSGDDLPYITE